MLIEQIIEFESRVPGPQVVHVFLKLVIFITKQNFKANLGANYLGSGYIASRGKITPCYFTIWRQICPKRYFASSAKIAQTQTLTLILSLTLTLSPTLILTLTQTGENASLLLKAK